MFSGDVELSPRWTVGASSGYDFKNPGFTGQVVATHPGSGRIPSRDRAYTMAPASTDGDSSIAVVGAFAALVTLDKRVQNALLSGLFELDGQFVAVDANDGSISATVKTPLYDSKRKLIGIAGMDILVTTIGEELLSKIKYEGEGFAFLVTDEGKLVYFPSFSEDFPPGSLIQDVDDNFRSAEGFGDFSKLVTKRSKGKSSVTWNNTPHTVLYTSIESDYPKMRWRLGFVVPDTVIDEPVNDAIAKNTAWVVITMLVVCALVYAATKEVVTTLIGKKICLLMD